MNSREDRSILWILKCIVCWFYAIQVSAFQVCLLSDSNYYKLSPCRGIVYFLYNATQRQIRYQLTRCPYFKHTFPVSPTKHCSRHKAGLAGQLDGTWLLWVRDKLFKESYPGQREKSRWVAKAGPKV